MDRNERGKTEKTKEEKLYAKEWSFMQVVCMNGATNLPLFWQNFI